MTAGFAVAAGWDLPVGDHSQVHAAVARAGDATRAGDTAVVVVAGAAPETRS